jgi:thiol-disulfide isomerase/thioredoxin
LSSGINAAIFGPEDGVIEMNDKNFYDHINKKKFMLTMFYAPWCHHCTKAAPEYIAAAEGLSTDHPPVHLGVVNGDLPETEGIRKHLKVDSYPTFIWWDYGVRMPYNVDHDRKTIMRFVREQTGVLPTSG